MAHELIMLSGTPFRLVNAEENWGWIGPLVEGIDPSDNAGNGVRQACMEGSALCLVSDDGLLVVELQPSGNGELELFVRLAVAQGAPGSIQRNEGNLDLIARELGAKKIVFHTYRPGMRRALGPEWKETYTVFERPVKR